MKEYSYLMKMRPPTPGAMPREGLVRAEDRNIYIGLRHYWGEAVYSRKLTESECDHYDMEPHGTFHAGAEKEGDT